jgi:hypothetical protein
MVLTPALRKLVLTAHITFTLGWLGALAAFLALAITGLVSGDTLVVRAVYLTAEPVTWSVIVPLAVASLLTGVVQALGTPWGLFRHYWVIFKLLLTVLATIVLLNYMQTASFIAGLAADPTFSSDDFLARRTSMAVLHAAGGLVVLLVPTALAVFKPRGLTRYGWRKQQRAAQRP